MTPTPLARLEELAYVIRSGAFKYAKFEDLRIVCNTVTKREIEAEMTIAGRLIAVARACFTSRFALNVFRISRLLNSWSDI